MPGFARRGMSGLATEAVISELADGSGLLEISGADWGQPLRETIHDHFTASVSDFTGSRAQRLTAWVSGLFLNNSDFVASEPRQTRTARDSNLRLAVPRDETAA